MDEIKENEYIRTKNGKIDKVINDNYYISEYIECEKGIVDKENIVNHSKNIIDLIEVGDYVNGNYVSEIKEYEDGKTILVLIGIVDEKDIKTILTKEQYQANCYTVERKEE